VFYCATGTPQKDAATRGFFEMAQLPLCANGHPIRGQNQRNEEIGTTMEEDDE
jgi:hypothetical protein